MENAPVSDSSPEYTARAATNDPTKYTRLRNGEVVGTEGQYATINEAEGLAGGRRRSGVKAKTLRRMLKKAGLPTSGKKATLTKRCKKAHLMRGGDASASTAPSTAAMYPFASGMVGGRYDALSNTATYAGQLGGRRHGVKAKTLKKLLKKAGLKVSGKKATLRARAKKAHLVRGGAQGLGAIAATEQPGSATGGRRGRRSRRSSSMY